MPEETGKTRNWTYVVYPEGNPAAPKDWLDKLEDMHIKALVSPLHDKDIDANGKQKKAHWHLMLMFDGPKTQKSVQKVFSWLNAPLPQYIHSLTGEAKYLTHRDHADKHPYDPKDIKEFGGASYQSLLDKDIAVDDILDEIEIFIDEQGITELKDLAKYARSKRVDWKRVIRTNTVYINAYIRSNRYSGKD